MARWRGPTEPERRLEEFENGMPLSISTRPARLILNATPPGVGLLLTHADDVSIPIHAEKKAMYNQKLVKFRLAALAIGTGVAISISAFTPAVAATGYAAAHQVP